MTAAQADANDNAPIKLAGTVVQDLSHVSGLLMRQVWPLALVLCADRVPIVRMHLKVC